MIPETENEVPGKVKQRKNKNQYKCLELGHDGVQSRPIELPSDLDLLRNYKKRLRTVHPVPLIEGFPKWC